MVEVDQVYHLACPASPVHYQYNPIKTVKTSVMGSINVRPSCLCLAPSRSHEPPSCGLIQMLGLCKRVKARFLLTSTSEVYGDPLEHPQKESYWGNVNPIGPRACYDEGKRVAETLTYSYAKQDHVDVRVARIFKLVEIYHRVCEHKLTGSSFSSTFGPRMNENDGRVVSNFIIQALRGEDITVYGDGSNTRSFQYVHDLVDGLIALMNANYTEPVNLGNPGEFSSFFSQPT
jgi:UDP-glucuronate decarboxylase